MHASVTIPKNMIQKTRNHSSNEKLASNAYGSYVHNIQNMESTKITIIRWMHKGTMIYRENGILFSQKEILSFAPKWMK